MRRPILTSCLCLSNNKEDSLRCICLNFNIIENTIGCTTERTVMRSPRASRRPFRCICTYHWTIIWTYFRSFLIMLPFNGQNYLFCCTWSHFKVVINIKSYLQIHSKFSLKIVVQKQMKLMSYFEYIINK